MTLGSHQKTVGASQVHLTPRWIIEVLGPFDLDPCAADPRPLDCAEVNLCEPDDGLRPLWAGRVWLNPPFDRYVVGRWIGRLAEHGRGTALLHARTETEWFRVCWERATAILFMVRRLTFVKPDGTPCTTRSGERANSGAPPVLVAFGDYDAMRLRQFAAEHGGALVEGWRLFGAASLLSEAAE
jgi:DNA N-6-adenine-methyltransferase Dam